LRQALDRTFQLLGQIAVARDAKALAIERRLAP